MKRSIKSVSAGFVIWLRNSAIAIWDWKKVDPSIQFSIQQKDRERQQRKDQICQEELFAKAMREMKDEEIREDAFR